MRTGGGGPKSRTYFMDVPPIKNKARQIYWGDTMPCHWGNLLYHWLSELTRNPAWCLTKLNLQQISLITHQLDPCWALLWDWPLSTAVTAAALKRWVDPQLAPGTRWRPRSASLSSTRGAPSWRFWTWDRGAAREWRGRCTRLLHLKPLVCGRCPPPQSL